MPLDRNLGSPVRLFERDILSRQSPEIHVNLWSSSNKKDMPVFIGPSVFRVGGQKMLEVV